MTRYVAAYDTESPECLAGVRRIAEVHEAYGMPATFFMVAGLLDKQRAEYVSILGDNPLFEIACHTYTHMPLVDTPSYGKAGPVERLPYELVESKKRIEDVFGCEVTGFRPPVCAPDGLASATAALEVLVSAGYRYVSSVAWGPQFSMPALLVRPFTYAVQGFPDLWELPPCGWHENLLKGHNNIGPVLVGLFPPPVPEAMPSGYVTTPEQEFVVNNKPFIDRARIEDMPQVSLIWHPWSLHRLDPEMRMLELTFFYVKECGLATGTFAELLDEVRDGHPGA